MPRWSSSAAARSASASATCRPSTRAGRSTRRATTSSARAAPAPSATASSPAAAPGPDVRRVLELFAECKGKPSILYDHRPHLGSNRLPAVVKAIRRRIEALGGEVRFYCRVEDLDLRRRPACAADDVVGLHRRATVVAAGHRPQRPRHLTMLLRRGVPMVQKPFQIGVRIEQPQEAVNRVKYGRAPLEEKLGAADYNAGRPRAARPVHLLHVRRRLHHPERVGGGLLLHQRHEPVEARLAVRQQRAGGDGRRRGIRRRRRAGGGALAGDYERRAFEVGRGEYRCPIQRASDFLAGRPTQALPPCSYPRGLVLAEIAELVPPLVAARRCGTACRSWTAAGRAASCRRDAGRARVAGQLPGAHPARRRDAGSRRASPGCIRSARGRATRAASSAPRWMD